MLKTLKRNQLIRYRSLIAVVAVVLVGATIYNGVAGADQYGEQIQALQQQNAGYQDRVNSLTAEAASYQDAINKLEQQINDLQQAIVANQQASAKLEEEIKALTAYLLTLKQTSQLRASSGAGAVRGGAR